jgi:hypothetical protein
MAGRGRIAVLARAARGTAFVRRGVGTDAYAVDWDLIPGAFDRLGRWGWPPGGIGIAIEEGSPGDGCAPQSEDPLEHRPAAGSGRDRFRQRIETTIVHSCPSPHCSVSHRMVPHSDVDATLIHSETFIRQYTLLKM